MIPMMYRFNPTHMPLYALIFGLSCIGLSFVIEPYKQGLFTFGIVFTIMSFFAWAKIQQLQSKRSVKKYG